MLLLVWPNPRSLATTSGISVDFSSSPYLDVSVQAVPHVMLFDSHNVTGGFSSGFPHSDISGSQLICSSPKLFAAYHVLHRLLMPRHSPCALISLTFVGISLVRPVSAASLRLLAKTTLSAAVPPLKFKPAALGFEFVSKSQVFAFLGFL